MIDVANINKAEITNRDNALIVTESNISITFLNVLKTRKNVIHL